MNGQILTKLETVEKELKKIKTLLKKKAPKPSQKTSNKLIVMKDLWKKLAITNKELEEAKKAVFDFDIEKYVGKGTK